jgi:DNA-binding GntR family transcriptional regulator
LVHESEISRWKARGQPASPSPTRGDAGGPEGDSGSDSAGRPQDDSGGRADADLAGRAEGDSAGRAGTESGAKPAARLIAERAYFELRDRIVTLRLPPREAIKRLALENLVEVRPRRGTYVTDVNVADIVHITEVRAELEGHAAQLAAMRMDDEHSRKAESLLAELEELDPQDSPTLMRIDERVHRLAWEAAGNPYLLDTLEGYFALSLRIWYLVLDRVPGLWTAVHDQREMIQALLTRDGPRARALMREHILAFQREIVVAFTQGAP